MDNDSPVNNGGSHYGNPSANPNAYQYPASATTSSSGHTSNAYHTPGHPGHSMHGSPHQYSHNQPGWAYGPGHASPPAGLSPSSSAYGHPNSGGNSSAYYPTHYQSGPQNAAIYRSSPQHSPTPQSVASYNTPASYGYPSGNYSQPHPGAQPSTPYPHGTPSGYYPASSSSSASHSQAQPSLGPSSSRERFYCPQCSYSFTRQHDLKRHISTIHNQDAHQEKCPRCKKTFSRADALKRHLDRTCGARDTDDE